LKEWIFLTRVQDEIFKFAFLFWDARHRIKEKDNQTYVHNGCYQAKPPQCNTHCKSTYAIPFKYGTLDGEFKKKIIKQVLAKNTTSDCNIEEMEMKWFL
jgi:hypothetical protein